MSMVALEEQYAAAAAADVYVYKLTRTLWFMTGAVLNHMANIM